MYTQSSGDVLYTLNYDSFTTNFTDNYVQIYVNESEVFVSNYRDNRYYYSSATGLYSLSGDFVRAYDGSRNYQNYAKNSTEGVLLRTFTITSVEEGYEEVTLYWLNQNCTRVSYDTTL